MTNAADDRVGSSVIVPQLPTLSPSPFLYLHLHVLLKPSGKKMEFQLGSEAVSRVTRDGHSQKALSGQFA